MKKRILSVFIAICLCLIWLPERPVEALSRDGLWGYNRSESKITKYFGAEANVKIPESIDGHWMDSIGAWAFYENAYVETVDLGRIKFVDGSAFRDCTNLKSVTGQKEVEIAVSAFKGCISLETIGFEIGGTEIGKTAFENCVSLKQITIPDTITTICEGAFKNCTSLKTIRLHKNISTLGNGAFYGCTSLDGIWTDGDHPKYANDDYGVLFSIDKVSLVAAPGGLTGTYTAPDTVCVLSAEAFGGCSKLDSIKLPNGVIDIGEGAFENCTGLNSFTIPTSLTTLRERLFQGCTALKSITLHKNVRYVKEGAFRGCSALGGIWTVKDNNWFSNDGSGVLFNKNRTTLVMAPGALSDTYVVPSTVTTLSAGAFTNCKQLKTVLLPDKVTSIGKRCFENCTALHTVVLPYKVEISEEMFSGCTALDTFVSNQTNIARDSAFKNCSGLKSLYHLKGIGYYSGHPYSTVTAHLYYLESEVNKTPDETEAALLGGTLTWVPLQSYCVAKGDHSTYAVGSDIGAIFLMMADWDKLSAVSVDGQQLNSDQYLSMTKGTAIVLKDAYLKTLSLGKHTLEVTYTDGSCTADFTLKEPCVHNVVKLPAVAATCTKTGLTEGSHCTKCGEVFVAQQTVDALGHSYSSTSHAATCTEGGYDLAKCSRCGKTQRSNETAPLGHDFSDWEIVKNPTFQEPGLQSRRCEACGKTEEKRIDPITAPPVEQPTEPPTEKPTEPPIEQPTEPNGTQPSEPSVTTPVATPTEPNQTDEPEQANLVPWIIAGGVLLVMTAAGALYLLRKKT